MKILVKRITKESNYTIGDLYIDGVFICNTLEDKDRGLKQTDTLNSIKGTKVYGETAIPYGTYKVVLNIVSPKFKDRAWATFCGGKLPRLVDVPGFDGVLIHVGNTAKDTLGCVLVGDKTSSGSIINSTITFKKLYNILQKGVDKGENLILTIE